MTQCVIATPESCRQMCATKKPSNFGHLTHRVTTDLKVVVADVGKFHTGGMKNLRYDTKVI